MPSEPFSKLLRRLRRAAHLTQEELAAKAGYSPDYVSMLERGLRPPPPLTVDILAKALRLEDADRTALRAADVQPQPPLPTVEPTTLVGREEAEEDAVAILRGTRLLTLTGPGGVGKTCLAARIVARAAPSFADGAAFVDLSPVTGNGVIAAIGAALGRSGDTMADIVARLQKREMLLVLDGFERFLPMATALTELLSASPKSKLLVTSRAALRLRAEHVMPVGPLALPAKGSDSCAVREAPAVALFVRCAQAIDPRFECTPEQAAVVASLCARLDGLPLAIELAAARLRHMPLSALAHQPSLGLLTGGARDSPARHRSMHDTIAWSYELLSPVEQTRLRVLSVFVGGFTLEAAEAVCEDDDLLPVIANLVDNSLIVLDRTCPEPRYRMLDTIREFCADLPAQAPEPRRTIERHGAYFTRFAEASEAGLQGREQLAWYRRIERDQDNLRVAVERLLATGDAEHAIRLAGSVWLFWQSHGDYRAGTWLEDAVERAATVPPAVRSKAYFGAAWLAFRRGEVDRATRLYEALLAHAEDTGDALGARNALTVAGHLALAAGRFEEAMARFQRGLELCRRLGRTWHLAMSVLNLGIAMLHAGRLDDARRTLSDALALHREIGDEIFAARAIGYLGYVALFAKDLERAAELFDESMCVARERGDEAGRAEALAGLAAVRAAQGRDAEAAQLASASDDIRSRSGWRPLPSDRAAWTRYVDRTR